MNINIEIKCPFQDKKAEAVKRMRLMKLMPNIIEEFEKESTVHYSEICGILYWVSNNEGWTDYIGKFEAKWNALVYHAELSHMEFGDCLSLFYVSGHRDEWERDIADLKEGYALCYVWNIDDPDCSEFGGITFKPMNGGVKRTG